MGENTSKCAFQARRMSLQGKPANAIIKVDRVKDTRPEPEGHTSANTAFLGTELKVRVGQGKHRFTTCFSGSSTGVSHASAANTILLSDSLRCPVLLPNRLRIKLFFDHFVMLSGLEKRLTK